MRKAVRALALSDPNRVGRRGWGNEGPFAEIYTAGLVAEKEVAAARIKGYLSQLDSLGANELFHLVDPLALHLTSDEADEVLNFGFDLLEVVLEAEDGDGPWDEALAPSSSCEEALAGYLWAGLARPSTAERWEHTHCVRNCLQLEWTSLLSALAARAASADPTPFVDRRLVFYEWHARQWLCLALARGAMDAPLAAAPFIAFLSAAAREQHVVIRHFASSALKCLHMFSELPADLLAVVDDENRPELAVETYARGDREVLHPAAGLGGRELPGHRQDHQDHRRHGPRGAGARGVHAADRAGAGVRRAALRLRAGLLDHGRGGGRGWARGPPGQRTARPAAGGGQEPRSQLPQGQ